ncbi:MAG TPA: magnesium transporter [Acidimicrobiia bacterium]|nr:magnesium transporter [Acidimicrobiia bacterium]
MLRSWRAAAARFRALLRSDAAGVRAGFVALLLSSGGDLLAGLTLGSITGTLEALPGLLVLVPAAIGMRGNVFGALGSRLSTAIHTGTFHLSRRQDTIVGQNLAASLSLSLSISLVLAVLAKVISVGFGLEHTISIADFVVISVIGGFLSSIVVMGITVGVASLSVRRDWDLDNVAAPIVTAAGDMVTLPALFLATYLVGLAWVTPVVAVLCAVAGVVALVLSIRSRSPILRRIARESLPVLALAGTIDIVAGLTIEKRFTSFLVYPALLVLVPPFLEDSGALGGILSARVSTKLHLGILEPGGRRLRAVVEDVLLVFMYAVPVFLLLGVSADIAAAIAGLTSPGSLQMIAVSMFAGAIATTFAVLVGFYGAVATFRLGLDPDNHGIPIVTSSLDLLGALALILAIVTLGLT